MLTQAFFDGEIDRLYATFGKAMPQRRVLSTMWDRVQEMNEEFFRIETDKLCSRSSLPQNVTQAYVDAWQEWVAKRTTFREDDFEENKCRERCEHGWFTLYSTKAPMAPFAFKCVCNNDPRFADQKAWTRAEIDKLPHLSWEDPFRTRAQREAWLARKAAAPEMDKVPF